MFGKRIDLFSILGFEVRIDLSWVIVAILIAWSLSTGVFPFRHEGLSVQTYWTMGILGAIGLFLSIIFHEMSHSLVARKFGIAIKGITLFIFGGVAEMKQEPPSPKAEFFMAAAGPLSSLLLALMFYALSQLARNAGWPEPVDGISVSGLDQWHAGRFQPRPCFSSGRGAHSPLGSVGVEKESEVGHANRGRNRVRIRSCAYFPGVPSVFQRKFHRGHVVVFYRYVSAGSCRHVVSTASGAKSAGRGAGQTFHET